MSSTQAYFHPIFPVFLELMQIILIGRQQLLTDSGGMWVAV